MVNEKGLDVLDERMESLNPNLKKNYKFLGCEQPESIKAEVVYKWVSKEMKKHMKALTGIQLYENI